PHRDELNYPAEYALSKPAHHRYGFSFQDPASRLPTEGTELLTARIVPHPPWANRDLKEQFSLRPLRGISRFLISIDGHDRCLSCLGLAHAEAAFVDGSCAHCECMSMATLRRLPFRKGFTAATARRLGDLQVTVQNVPPGKTPRASAPPRSPVVMPKQTAPPPKSGPSEEKMSISASEGEQSADEADVSAGRRPAAVAAPSKAEAELGSGWRFPRLNDWFLGTSRFGEAQIDLFASPESSHCQLYYSLNEAPLGRDAVAPEMLTIKSQVSKLESKSSLKSLS
ncbi:hypothetical protein M9458_056995, partial [Cirrhinus mrigala]